MVGRPMTDKLLDCIEGLWWQFAYQCGPPMKGHNTLQYRNSGGMHDLEVAEDILLRHGRIKKYRKNGRMEWYKPIK